MAAAPVRGGGGCGRPRAASRGWGSAASPTCRSSVEVMLHARTTCRQPPRDWGTKAAQTKAYSILTSRPLPACVVNFPLLLCKLYRLSSEWRGRTRPGGEALSALRGHSVPSRCNSRNWRIATCLVSRLCGEAKGLKQVRQPRVTRSSAWCTYCFEVRPDKRVSSTSSHEHLAYSRQSQGRLVSSRRGAGNGWTRTCGERRGNGSSKGPASPPTPTHPSS